MKRPTNVIFDRHTNSVTRAVLIAGNEHLATPQIVSEFQLLPVTFSDLLMRHDGVCFSVYGENLVAPMLLHAYGISGLRNLLEQKAVLFHLRTSMVTYLQENTPGVNPLQSGRLSSSPHSDPEQSVHEGLSRLSSPPPKYELKVLNRLLAEAYQQPSIDYAPTAVQLSHDGYTRGRFGPFGLSSERPLGELTNNDRATLCRFADEMLDLANISDLDMQTLDEFVISEVFNESLERLTVAKKVADASARIFEIENIPAFSQLIVNGVFQPSDIPSLRAKRDAIAFRRWLHETVQTVDATKITSEYINSITEKRWLETVPGRITKSLTVSTVSAAIGAYVAGPIGAAIGGIAGKVLDPATEVAIDLIDEFVLDGLLKGRSPRNYFDKLVRPAVKTTNGKQ